VAHRSVRSHLGRAAVTAVGDSLEGLLEKLRQGDAAAATQLFLAYEPYLRLVVRRQISAALRAKFDSADVVQSVWASVLQGFRQGSWHFRDAEHLRAFLVKATRNRFLDRVRQHLRELEHEQRLVDEDDGGLPPSPHPRPGEVAQAEELWQRLLGLCPAAHVEVLHLKRQGLPLAEIAARTGLHEGSVRRILYEVARRLAADPDARKAED
jgi:RNA polymerase sigma factor (sigma-70 family)